MKNTPEPPTAYTKKHLADALTWVERNVPNGIVLVARALSSTGDDPHCMQNAAPATPVAQRRPAREVAHALSRDGSDCTFGLTVNGVEIHGHSPFCDLRTEAIEADRRGTP